MPVDTNLREFTLDLASIGRSLDLLDDDLGRDILHEQALRIQARSLLGQSDPEGRMWALNKEPYASSPRKLGKPIGVLTGRMLSLPEIEGESIVDHDLAVMQFGASDESRAIAEYFTDGRPVVQAARPFYEMSREDEDAIVRQVEDHITRAIARLG